MHVGLPFTGSGGGDDGGGDASHGLVDDDIIELCDERYQRSKERANHGRPTDGKMSDRCVAAALTSTHIAPHAGITTALECVSCTETGCSLPIKLTQTHHHPTCTAAVHPRWLRNVRPLLDLCVELGRRQLSRRSTACPGRRRTIRFLRLPCLSPPPRLRTSRRKNPAPRGVLGYRKLCDATKRSRPAGGRERTGGLAVDSPPPPGSAKSVMVSENVASTVMNSLRGTPQLLCNKASIAVCGNGWQNLLLIN